MRREENVFSSIIMSMLFAQTNPKKTSFVCELSYRRPTCHFPWFGVRLSFNSLLSFGTVLLIFVVYCRVPLTGLTTLCGPNTQFFNFSCIRCCNRVKLVEVPICCLCELLQGGFWFAVHLCLYVSSCICALCLGYLVTVCLFLVSSSFRSFP